MTARVAGAPSKAAGPGLYEFGPWEQRLRILRERLGKRKWNRLHPVRPRTKDLRTLGREVRRELRHLPLIEGGADAEANDVAPRPRTRGECAGVPRPCPFVGCRHHLYLEVRGNGSIRFTHPEREPWELPPDASCALDVAEAGPLSHQAIGDLLNVTDANAEQIEGEAFRKLAHRWCGLRRLLRLLDR